MLPSAGTTEADGQLGIQPPLSGLPMAIVGQCSGGDFNTPTSCASVDQVKSLFTGGRGVEEACHEIVNYGRSVVIVRTETTGVADVISAVDSSGKTGTSAITVTGEALDDYEVIARFPTGGTIGTAGIVMQVSLDAGRSYNADVKLGTANTYLIPGTGCTLNFAAGTIVADDEIKFQTEAAHPDDTELGDALDALKASSLLFEVVHTTSPLDASGAAVVSSWLTEMHSIGRHKCHVGHFRVQGIYASDTGGADETDAEYTTAFDDEFSAFADPSMHICAGAVKMASSANRGRRYRRSPSYAVAAKLSSVTEEIDIAAIVGNRLPGVELLDAKGNADPGYYNEAVSPGLDDARALTVRTWEGETGVYVNNPRLISAVGSDFDFSPKRRVMNLARTIATTFLRRRVLSIKRRTRGGKIRESELQALEADVNSELTRKIIDPVKAEAVRVVLSRTDNVLAPPYPLTGKLRLVPLAYPKDASLEASWALEEPIVIEGT